MKKMALLLLIMAVFLNAKALNNPSQNIQVPSYVIPNQSTQEIPEFTGEHQGTFVPVLYNNGTEITFSNGISFDTKILGKNGEPDLPQNLTFGDDETNYYIVQFNGPIYQAQKDWLADNNATIHFYVPQYGFVCSMSEPASADAIRANSAVTWVGVYQPAYKISSLFEQYDGVNRVTILLFMDVEIDAVFNEIKAISNGSDFETSDNGINKIIWGNVDRNIIDAIARIPGVYWIEPYIHPELHNDNVQWIVQSGTPTVRSIWAHGIMGQNEIVDNCDVGINGSHYSHRAGSSAITNYGYFPTHNKIVAYDSGGPSVVFGAVGSYHGTHTGGTLCGNDTTQGSSTRDGVAKMAKNYHLCIGDGTGGLSIFGDYNDVYGRCYNRHYPPTRAHISTNSWGSAAAGAYGASCLMADQFMWTNKDFLLCYSAGNSGTNGSIGAPACAKSVVAVGGCRNGTTGYTQFYSWTSRGPTQDGRIKPDVVTPAQTVYSATSGTSNYGGMQGTSMSAPSAGGAACLARQYLREGWYPTGAANPADAFSFISNAMLKAILVNCSDPNVGSGGAYLIPSMLIGWGRVDLDSTLFFAGEARKTLLVDHTVGILTGEVVEYHFDLPSGAQDLKIAVVWTDYPGNPAVLTQLVNDVDLYADIGATYYRGNQYSNGQSVANPAGRDQLNPVECIRVNSPTAGNWRVRIEGQNIPYGPQPFALVITYNAGAIAGVVTTDKPVYLANDFNVDTVHIRVEDTNYGSSGSIDQVDVVINGASIETQPETLACTELSADAYVFVGDMPLYFHKAVHGDGRLSVCQGDTIYVSYTDANPSYTATTFAAVDAEYFRISDVHCENILSQIADACWTTDDNANSIVRYGVDPGNLNQTAYDTLLYSLPHRVTLTGLSPQTLYYYDVESEDFRGNLVVDNNGGNHYSFTTSPGGGGTDVLVCVLNSDGFEDAFEHADFLTYALDQGGWTYDWWQTNPMGDFSRDQIKVYKAVNFQVGQTGGMGGNYPVWTVAQKETIKVYHDGGARFAMTGFDMGWDPWMNSPSADTVFCKNHLHFRYIGDITATSWQSLRGMPSDPISGAYTGGVLYHPFRDGAAGDSIRLSGTGAPGTGTYVWHGGVPNDSCGIKWESQNPMGTPGDGVWGGYQTRVVSNAFEITQIDTTNPTHPARTDILNNMFIWLIGHDHPDVTLNSPQGGQTYNSSPITIDWTAVAHGGATIDTTWIEYSPDGGQTWIIITSGTGVTSPYSWDVSALTNGVQYQVRVTVNDTGIYPSMKGSDGTTDFTINIPGNDFSGPKVIPQSIYIPENPMIVTPSHLALELTATATDSFTGASDIAAAEWWTSSNPHLAMSAVDGSFNEIQEDVIDTMTFVYMPGNTEIDTIMVRAQDAATNWGNPSSRTFTVIDGQLVFGIAEGNRLIPIHFSLSKPIPNPFTRNVEIRYGIPKTKKIALKIYNSLGQVVKTLADGTAQPGMYQVFWNGTDDLNRKVSAGIYFYRFSSDEFTDTKKMVMIR